jgi:hypothetical protein
VRPAPALRRTAADAAEQRRRHEPDLAERGGEQRVVLEAVAAAPFVEKLPLEIGEAEPNRTAQLNRDVLEEKRLAMREMQPPKRLQIRRDRRRHTNASEVILQAHGPW